MGVAPQTVCALSRNTPKRRVIMSNQNSPPMNDTKRVAQRLRNVRINVIVDTREITADSRRHADRIIVRLKAALDRAVAEAASAGITSQIMAVKDGLKKACDEIDSGAVIAVKAIIRGEYDGVHHYREFNASPPLPRTA
jgi:hypothetical protein